MITGGTRILGTPNMYSAYPDISTISSGFIGEFWYDEGNGMGIVVKMELCSWHVVTFWWDLPREMSEVSCRDEWLSNPSTLVKYAQQIEKIHEPQPKWMPKKDSKGGCSSNERIREKTLGTFLRHVRQCCDISEQSFVLLSVILDGIFNVVHGQIAITDGSKTELFARQLVA